MAAFHSFVVSLYFSCSVKCLLAKQLVGSIMNGIMAKAPCDGIGGTVKNVIFRKVKSVLVTKFS